MAALLLPRLAPHPNRLHLGQARDGLRKCTRVLPGRSWVRKHRSRCCAGGDQSSPETPAASGSSSETPAASRSSSETPAASRSTPLSPPSPPTTSSAQDIDINAPFLRFAAQCAVVLAALAFVDAGYSGDWSRIGAISKDLESSLRPLAFIVVPVSGALVYWIGKLRK